MAGRSGCISIRLGKWNRNEGYPADNRHDDIRETYKTESLPPGYDFDPFRCTLTKENKITTDGAKYEMARAKENIRNK